jgi:hypothetical protein
MKNGEYIYWRYKNNELPDFCHSYLEKITETKDGALLTIKSIDAFFGNVKYVLLKEIDIIEEINK